MFLLDSKIGFLLQLIIHKQIETDFFPYFQLNGKEIVTMFRF